VPRRLPFLDHNLLLVGQLLDREARGRRRDLLVSEDIQAAFYAERLPSDICTWMQLENWWRGASEADRQPLFFTEEELTAKPEVSFGESDYPAQLKLQDAAYRLKYRFAPGEPDDGVSIEVPLGLLSALVSEALEWSVPGFFPAVCEQWLKSLPKSKRRHLAPVPEKVEMLLPLLVREGQYRQGRLSAALAKALADLFGLQVDAADWDRGRIDPHLLMNVKVIGLEGELLDQGRDLDALKAHFADQLESRLQQGLPADLERSALSRFPDDAQLSGSTVLEDDAGQVVVYPAFVDMGDHVDLKLLHSQDAQREANRRGYARLGLLHVGQMARRLKKRLDRERDLGLHYAPLGPAGVLYDEVLRGAAWYCFFEDRPLPETEDAFVERISREKARLTPVFEEVLEMVRTVFRLRFDIVRSLDEMSSPAFAAAVEDVRAHLQRLVPADLLSVTPRIHLSEIPRYLEGVRYRLGHLQGKVLKDQELMAVVVGFEERLERLQQTPAGQDSRWQQLKFALEELRLGLFAEPVGTRGKVSPKRLDGEFLARERELGLV
jgi:ATP-dependent helicase HrpA